MKRKTALPIVFCLGLFLHPGLACAEEMAVPKLETATFAAGCFWCGESDFEKIDGVVSAVSGFAGGSLKDPTYDQVSAGGTGHAEVVQVSFDPKKISYEKLVDAYWHIIDPLDAGGQFCDRGNQYRSEIFAESDAQYQTALASKKKLQESGQLAGEIQTQVTRLEKFYPAEDYHQDFYKTHPERYHSYRWGCGRDRRLEELWGKK